MALFVYPPISVDTTGLATEAKQDAMIVELQDIDASTGLIVTSNAAIETSNAAIQSDVTSLESKVATAANQVTIEAELSSIDTNTVANGTRLDNLDSNVTGLRGEVSTAAKQDTQLIATNNMNSNIQGDLFAVDHDGRAFTYIPAGLGVGEPQSIVLTNGAATVRTITFSYTTNALGVTVVGGISFS